MNKILSVVLLACFCTFIFTSCNKEQSAITETIEATIAPNETYTYKFAPVDDQLEISTQAQHYSASKVITDATTSASVFTYTPSENFIGTDLIEVKNSAHQNEAKPACGTTPPPTTGSGNCKGGGQKHQKDDVTYIFKITVKNTVLPG